MLRPRVRARLDSGDVAVRVRGCVDEYDGLPNLVGHDEDYRERDVWKSDQGEIVIWVLSIRYLALYRGERVSNVVEMLQFVTPPMIADAKLSHPKPTPLDAILLILMQRRYMHLLVAHTDRLYAITSSVLLLAGKTSFSSYYAYYGHSPSCLAVRSATPSL